MRARGDDSEPGAGRMGDAATRLAQDAAELARQEIRAIHDEARSGLRRFAAGGTLLAGAGLCGVLALAAGHETVLRAAESVMPRSRASMLLTCVYVSATAALALGARNRMRAAAEAAATALEQGRQTMPAAEPEQQTPEA
jgi:Putative Actinobacterial Holin-X, holin superfamily III